MTKKKIDNLTRDAMAAEAAGMSYGKYKGLQHAAGQQQPAPAPKKSTRKTFDLICTQCGQPFVGGSRLRKYCSEDCKKKHDSALLRERHTKTTTKEE